MVKSRLYVAEDLVQKLQQAADKLIFVLVLLKVRQAAAAGTDASSHQLLHILTALADGEQRRLQFLGDVGRLHHVTAEQGEGVAAGGVLIQSNQLRQVQSRAGGSGQQSSSRLQDTDRLTKAGSPSNQASAVSGICIFKWMYKCKM